MIKVALNLNHMVFELLGFKMTSDRVGHIIKNDQREKILSRIFTKFAPIKNCDFSGESQKNEPGTPCTNKGVRLVQKILFAKPVGC